MLTWLLARIETHGIIHLLAGTRHLKETWYYVLAHISLVWYYAADLSSLDLGIHEARDLVQNYQPLCVLLHAAIESVLPG